MLMENLPQTRKERLDALAKHAGGNAALGRKLGYKDGALIWQMLNDVRPISEKFIAKVHAVHEWRDWFSQDASLQANPAPHAGVALATGPSTLEQALQIIDDALAPLDAADRRAALSLLKTGMEPPGRASSVALMLSGSIAAMSSKRKAA